MLTQTNHLTRQAEGVLGAFKTMTSATNISHEATDDTFYELPAYTNYLQISYVVA